MIALDIYSFDPRTEAPSIRRAQRTYSAYNELLALGVYLEVMRSSVWAAVAGSSAAYRIAWASIQCPLLWVNTELGYGEQYYGAIAAREAGNANVQTHVVAGYAHSDIMLGRSARTEVWPLLSP